MHLSSPPHVLHALPISIFLNWSPEWYYDEFIFKKLVFKILYNPSTSKLHSYFTKLHKNSDLVTSVLEVLRFWRPHAKCSSPSPLSSQPVIFNATHGQDKTVLGVLMTSQQLPKNSPSCYALHDQICAVQWMDVNAIQNPVFWLEHAATFCLSF
jgi:hypothetical protein